ncbi:MAG: hypothetical protein ABIR79_04720 [Candidatus Binatia bacterium]
METFGMMIREYRWLALALLLAAATATGIVSCGGGSSGGTDGGLCEQCGQTDGPCISPALIVPGANEPAPCPTAPLPETCVARELICRRGVDTARQRCYPANASGTDVDAGFRCKGTRPGSTLAPSTATPSAATAVPTPTKTADLNALCGDGSIQGLEQCEGSNFGSASCANQCSGDGTGRLQCFGCQIDTTLCDGPCP